MPRRRRTTARITIALLALWVGAGTANAAVPTELIFPVVGKVSFQDDFGDPRGSRSHQGNDIMAARWSPVVAVERGWIEKPSWARTECMLKLKGVSGTHYWYLHLNNDLTRSNDNRGGCKNGVSFAPGLRDGQVVRKGQLIGYVGNSGNANWTLPHLHFELHPNGGRAISPYRWLIKAPRLLFAIPEQAARVVLTLRGRLTSTETTFTMRVEQVIVERIWRGTPAAKTVSLPYAENYTVERMDSQRNVTAASIADAKAGERVTVWTTPVVPNLYAQRGTRNVLVASRIRLRGTA